MSRLWCGIAAWIGLLLTGSSLSYGAAISPQFQTFGTLAGATFGGNGIPNNAVAITTLSDGGATITLGLTVHQRFASPPVSHDGAGTFSVLPGEFPGEPGTARWNLGVYAAVENGTFSNYQFELLYDSNPGVGTDAADHGVIYNAGFQLLNPVGNVFQTTQNLGFDFLRDGLAFGPVTYITAPTFSFDPAASGEYTFSLRVYNAGDALLGSTSIAVNSVPEPSTWAIFAVGAFGAVVAVRRRRRAEVAAG